MEERSLPHQLATLKNGIGMLQDALGVTPVALIPPEHIYTTQTLEAMVHANLRVISKKFKATWDGRAFYALGRALRRDFLMGKRVSYHPGPLRTIGLRGLSITVELARNHHVKLLCDILCEYARVCRHTNTVGFLIHPQVLRQDADRARFWEFLREIHRRQWRFRTLREMSTQGISP